VVLCGDCRGAYFFLGNIFPAGTIARTMVDGGRSRRLLPSSESRTMAPHDDEEIAQCPTTEGMLELDNLHLRNGANNTDVVRTDSRDESDDDSDDDDNDGISSSYHSAQHNHHPNNNNGGSSITTAYCLGYSFLRADHVTMRSFQKSLYWFTYRNDLVVPLRPYRPPVQSFVGNLTHGGGFSGAGGGEGMKTDAGWGCMLRSAQMLFAQAVRRHFTPTTTSREVHATISNNKRLPSWKRNKKVEDPWEVERIARWFADFPGHVDFNENPGDDDCLEEYGKGGINNHWYSLHQMVAAGLGLGVLPGEWYGPTTACHVLRELNEIHCDKREQLAKKQLVQRTIQRLEDGKTASPNNSSMCDMFRVHIAMEGCIYLDAITKLMTKCSCQNQLDTEVPESSHPHSTSSKKTEIIDPLRAHLSNDAASQSSARNASCSSEKDITWDTSLLLLLPLRLGIQSIDSSKYGSTLAKLMSFPQSVGMLGGTPRHALWFYGADAVDLGNEQDCGGWYGLDPHTVQMAPRGTQTVIDTGDNNNDPKYQWETQITESYLQSLHLSANASHFNHERAIPLSGLDTSCALGFYLRDYSDFCQFTSLLDALANDHCRPNELPEIITVAEKTPNYEDGVTSAMKDMVGDDGLDDFSVDNEEANDNEEDDEDDFVLI
jgi:cysteine protease ATG4